MDTLKRLDAFHKTGLGYLVFGMLELGLGYLAVLWATDSGSLVAWVLVIVLLLGTIQNFVLLIWRSVRRGR